MLQSVAPQQHFPPDVGPVPNPMPKLLSGEDLPSEDAEHLFERLVLGRLEPAEIAGMLVALRLGYLGTLIPSKGLHVLIDAVLAQRQGTPQSYRIEVRNRLTSSPSG